MPSHRLAHRGLLRGLPCALLLTAFALRGVVATAADADRVAELRGLSLEELLEVEVVTASRHAESWFDVPAAIHVIRQEDIRRSGATSLPELLRGVPGVHVARVNASTWAVSARGFADAYADKLLVLIDGRSIYTPLFSGVFWDAHDLVLADIERIEVIRGPGASIWGVNAVNGVINIITKSAAETAGTLVHASVGDEDRAVGALRHGFSAGPADVRVWGKHARRDALGAPKGTSLADGGDAWRCSSAGLRLDWAGARDRVSVHAGGLRNRTRSVDAALSLEQPHSTLVEADGRYSGWNLLARWDRRLSDRSSLTVSAWTDATRRVRPDWTERREQQDLDLKHRFVPGPRHDLTWGIGWRRSSDAIRGSFQVAFSEPRYVIETVNGFVQDRIALGDRTSLTLGTKLDRDRDRTIDLQPSLRLRWAPRDGLVAWGAVSRALRTPNRVDRHVRVVLDVADDPSGGPLIVQTVSGRRRQESEEVLAFEIGARWSPSSRLVLDGAAFYDRHDRLRSLEPGAPELVQNGGEPHLEVPFTLDGLAEGRSLGTEIQLTWVVHPRWTLTVSHAYLSSRIRPSVGSRDVLGVNGGGRGHDPRHRLHLRSQLDLPRGIELDVEVDRAASWNGADLPAHTRVDLRLGWRSRSGLDVALDVDDLFANGEPEHAGRPFDMTVSVPQRSARLALTWRL